MKIYDFAVNLLVATNFFVKPYNLLGWNADNLIS